jgi:hypothetical protein
MVEIDLNFLGSHPEPLVNLLWSHDDSDERNMLKTETQTNLVD